MTPSLASPPLQVTLRLRPEVELVLDRGQLVALRDPLLERRIPVGPIARALVPRLDGTRGPEALVAEVAAVAGEAVPEVERSLRALLLVGLLEGAGDAARAALRRALAAPLPAPVTLPEARFGCAGSGSCCQVYDPGPLTEGDVAALAGASPALAAACPELPPQPWVIERTDEAGATWRYLKRTEEGRCIFLRPDQRCRIHAVAGLEAKPEACRLFPFDTVRTFDGLRVFDHSQCSSFATTARQGAPHAEQAAAVARLLPQKRSLFHPLALLDGATPCDYAPLRALERHLVEVTTVPPGPAGARLLRYAALARAFAAALAACPLTPGQPDATVAAVLAADLRGETPPLPAVPLDEAEAALAAAARALLAALDAPGQRDAPLVPALREVLSALAEPEGPLLAAVRATPLDREEAGAVLRLSLRNRLFGSRLLLEGRLPAGLLRQTLIHAVTATGARLRAAALGRAATAADLSAGHWVISLAMARPTVARALLPVESGAWAAVQAAAALCDG